MDVARALETLERRPKWQLAASCLLGLVLVGGGDFLTPDNLVVTLFYLLPVSAGAWFVSRSFALFLAFAGAMTYFLAETQERSPGSFGLLLSNAVLEAIVFAALAVLFSSLKAILQAERNARAAAELRLTSLLPICSACKKVRSEPDGTWDPFDLYLHKHSDTQLTHGMCPDCMAQLYPKQFKKLQQETVRQ